MRRVVVALVALTAVAGLGAFGISRLSNVHIPFLTDTCRVYASETVVRVEPDQLTHAATIAAVGARRQLPERAVTIALATMKRPLPTVLTEVAVASTRAGPRSGRSLMPLP